MKRRFYVFGILLILILAFTSVLAYSAPPPAKVIIVNPRPGFKVSVSTSKTSYTIGERIKIYCSI